MPIELVLSNTLGMRVKAIDISLAGMHFICDRWDAQQILPPGESVVPGKPVKATIRLKLPGTTHKLNIFSEIISVMRLAENRYRINLRFVSFWGDSKAALQGYLAEMSSTT